MTKKKSLIIILLITILIVFVYLYFGIYFINKAKFINMSNKATITSRRSNTLSILLENSDGEYKTSSLSSWPDYGYSYNETLSYCKNGSKITYNSEDNTFSFNVSKADKCYIYFDLVNETTEFDYTGEEQTFIVPASGTYKLETWGAQGGGNKTLGGYGGYSSGEVRLLSGDILYINVGGSTSSYAGGYNGGGSNTGLAPYGGGGATDIATKSGLLSSLENNINSILIVSGGGGGFNNVALNPGGSGGGYKGTDGTGDDHGFGGSQSSGGIFSSYIGANGSGSGSFGLGGSGEWHGEYLGAGGGGYYGGSSAGGYLNNGSGGGGSGYIGNSLLTNKMMYCYNCEESDEESTKTISTTNVSETPTSEFAKIGNGYAKITYLGE